MRAEEGWVGKNHVRRGKAFRFYSECVMLESLWRDESKEGMLSVVFQEDSLEAECTGDSMERQKEEQGDGGRGHSPEDIGCAARDPRQGGRAGRIA